MALYLYDVECIPNLFSVIFLKSGQTKLIDKYIEADKAHETNEKTKILDKLDYKLFIIYSDNKGYERNDLDKLVRFLTRNNRKEELTIVGYNNFDYDDIMIDYIYTNYKQLKYKSISDINEELKKLNDLIIHDDRIYFEFRSENNIPYNKSYNSIDLQRLNNLHKLPNRISLKQVSISLKWYKLEEYVMPEYTDEQVKELYGDLYTSDMFTKTKSFDRKIHSSEVDNIISYNWNDVFITDKLLIYSIDELKSRIRLKQKYGLHVLSSPRSGTAEKVMRLLYSQYTGLNYQDFINQRTWRKKIKFGDIIDLKVKFKSKVLIDFLNILKRSSINVYGDDKFNFTIVYNNILYKMGLGGLHSKDMGAYYSANKNTLILDADVDSYYPRSIVINKIKPQHLSVIVVDIIKNLLEQRLYYKRNKDEINSYIYKIIINSIFGKLGDANSIFKDDKALYSVTINNQLYLLMLIEALELNKFKVISCNTDGVTALVNKNKIEDYNTVLNKWSNNTGFTLEVNNYDLYVRTTVNDYLAVINNTGIIKIKRKGDFDQFKYNELSSGYYYPIVPRAIEEYYINNIPVEQTIRNCTDILDFCMTQKTGGKYINEYHVYNKTTGKLEIKTLPKQLRYYASTIGGVLIKRNLETNKTINILKGQYVQLLQMVDNTDIKDYNVNYLFYIVKAKEIINIKVPNQQTTVMKKHSGRLFDNLEDY